MQSNNIQFEQIFSEFSNDVSYCSMPGPRMKSYHGFVWLVHRALVRWARRTDNQSDNLFNNVKVGWIKSDFKSMSEYECLNGFYGSY